MLDRSIQKSMIGALIGAMFGGLLMGIPGALFGGFGVGLTVYIMERQSRERTQMEKEKGGQDNE